MKKKVIIIAILILLAGVSLIFLKNGYRNAKNHLRVAECEVIPEIVCIGDSLTGGTDGSYPEFLEKKMIRDGYYIPVFNLGIGGENTVTIAGRLGGIPYRVYEFDMPEDDTPVKIEFADDDVHKILPFRQLGNNGINPVVINGVPGELSLNEDGMEYYFTRIFDDDDLTESQERLIEEAASEDNVANAAEDHIWDVETRAATSHEDGIYIIFMGENGGFESNEELIAQQKAILDRQVKNSDKYLIIGLSTGTAEMREELDELMQKEYGNKFINIREYLSGTDAEGRIFQDARKYGVEFTDEDIAEMQQGMVPGSLRGDDIHFNKTGYMLLADVVYERIIENGYFDDIQDDAGKYLRVWGMLNRLEIEINERK